jgi:hypothetical protein
MTGTDFYSTYTISGEIQDLTGVQGSDELAPVLEAIVAEQMPRVFAALAETLDWSDRRPDELTVAIDLALQQEMPALAIRLAQLGGQLFPDHERIQRAARVLAPPNIQSTHLPPAEGLEASRRWLREHATEYHGQWVAVREGQLVGAAPTLDELEVVRGEDIMSILVTKVPQYG